MEKSAVKILYIEDDHFIGQMYSDFLEGQGYQVTLETNGKTGLALARDKKFDLILLDIMLPGINGDQILYSLRGKENLIPETKVIIMTNYQQPEESKQNLELKADAYIIKTDLMPTELLKLIKKILDQT